MWTYSLRAVPWPLVLSCSALQVILVMLVEYDPWRLWPLQGIAVGLLAAVAGWCLDEPAAGVVDPSPRGIRWRTSARLIGVVLPLVVWLAMVRWAREAMFGHWWAVSLQGVTAVMVSLAWGVWRRSCAVASPGQRWGAVVVPMVTAWALIRPASLRLPVFPYATDQVGGSWTSSTVGWSVAGVAAMAVLVVVLSGDGRMPRVRPPRRRPVPRHGMSPGTVAPAAHRAMMDP
ncbi:hypothetical protein [Acidipropionibacterium jensenii]|uniref:hypothetical protein n=1 Tax=Acidipropionibacterium jensenii TaxID=1749 RepID=UPI00214C8210|nr:hypothetical protein [Acidipropionibacterium jensenii]